MIGSRGLPAALSGVERVVEELTVELTALGHEVLIYARPWYLRKQSRLTWTGSGRVITTPGLAGKNTDALSHTASAMWDVLRRNVDVVHVHCAGPALLSFLPAAASLPITFTVHAPEWDRARWSRLGKLALRTGLNCGMKFASAVSAVSLNLRDYLADAYNREVEYIPNGVRAVQLRRPDKIGGWGLKTEGYCLYVGRIVQEKRLDLLIGAWREMKITVPLVIAGDGRQEPGYEAECKRQANELVRFVGPQFGTELAELYSNAAVVVQPSELEGMSLVLLEAAAYGRCVVAREMPATRDALGDGVVTFAGDSVEALGETIEKCLNDPALRRSTGAEAKRRVTEQFSWPVIARQYERLYQCAVRR
ncbi:MAG: glycosyltransferase family 4 protein [Planctomycetota bacterium]|nr:glycosyltransferase family 4 protein [Planctomycetota bacterium]